MAGTSPRAHRERTILARAKPHPKLHAHPLIPGTTCLWTPCLPRPASGHPSPPLPPSGQPFSPTRPCRYSSAFYLVKWLGKPRWDVSWEDAATLDTPWSRRLIAASISSETDGSRASGRPLLPPCHPLVDLLPTLPSPDAAKAGDAAHVGRTGATPGTSASPAPAPAAGSAPAPAATGADARTHLPPGWSAMQKVSKSGKAYTRYVGPGGRVADSKPKAWAIAGAQEEGSAGAGATGPKSHTPSRGQGASAACPPMAVLPSSVAYGAAGQPGTPPATSSQLSSLERAAAKPGSYIGYLCYLREHRARLRAAAPGCTGKQLEKAAAEEWKSLPHEERAPVIQRARELMDQKLEAARGGADSDPRVVIGREETGTGATGDRGGRAAVAAGVNGRGRRACECCGELDQRDALRCNTCAARRHLMCFFPPLVEADAVPWVCEACTDAAMAGQQLRCVPAAGEEIEVEVSQPESAGGAGCWTPAVVRRQLAEGRFSAVIGGDEDFVEEFGMESEGEQWRRAMATIAELERRRAETQAARGDTLARRRREAEGARLDTEVQSAPLLDKVEQLYRDGLVIADGAITPQQARPSSDRNSTRPAPRAAGREKKNYARRSRRGLTRKENASACCRPRARPPPPLRPVHHPGAASSVLAAWGLLPQHPFPARTAL